ncbi:hypothetical protein JW905_12015 [bacterium]|nr:hypothetical protein [candidate division CSSED10-310 bacterium]
MSSNQISDGFILDNDWNWLIEARSKNGNPSVRAMKYRNLVRKISRLDNSASTAIARTALKMTVIAAAASGRNSPALFRRLGISAGLPPVALSVC